MKKVAPSLTLASVILFVLMLKQADASAGKGHIQNPSAFDTVVASFKQGPYGSIVVVGQDKDSNDLRIGAAAHIGVSPDSYDKYRFAIYVEARDEAGKIVLRHSDVMGKEFSKGDSYKTGAYITAMKTEKGTYTITAVLTAIAKDGSVTVLDAGKTSTVTFK
jgi:hypothetical protein